MHFLNYLCSNTECTKLDVCVKPITGSTWEQFLKYYESNPSIDDGLPAGYICNYCLKKFRAGLLPACCILNGLMFNKVPTEIAKLNQYEKVITQHGNAFQVITKMKTVAGKQ